MLYVVNLFMKKVLLRIKMYVMEYKKKLIYGALALFIGQICFFNLGWVGVNNAVYAVNDETPTQAWEFQEKAGDWLDKLSFLKKWCYILLYPILVLAGALVNNSMVYAEVFSFDAILWQLWNIMRNLANYVLWFIFVFKIFWYLTSGQKSSDLSSLLKSSLIAWIWIQASWFLLAVLIDVSNILTYSVGWLPIHILWTQKTEGVDSDFWNPYVFQTVISVDLKDSDSIYYYLSSTSTGENQRWNHFISECETFSFKYASGNEELIVAPKVVYYYDWKTYHSTEQFKCHVWDDVFYLRGFADGIVWQTCSEKEECANAQIKYMDSVKNAIIQLNNKKIEWIKWEVKDWKVLQIKNAHLTWEDAKAAGIRHSYEDYWVWLDVDNKLSWNEWGMAKLHDILEGDDWYVWVFSVLYSSLLNAGEDFRIPNSSIYGELLNTVLSLCHMLVVGIPLLAMLVVFLMRIWVIWMAIVLSPVIVLFEAFKLWDKDFIKNIKILQYFKLGSLIGIIFSPAVICFAVSISTVLVRIISTVNAENFMVDKTPILWWLIQIEIGWLWVGIWKLICSIIWVAISRFLVWTAIQMSSLWKSSLITSIKKFATSALWSVPIIPVPWWKDWISFVWVDAAKQIPSILEQTVKSTYGWKSEETINDIIDPSRVAWRRADAYKEKIMSNEFMPVTNWTSQEIEIKSVNWSYKQSFDNLSRDKKKDIITAINGDEKKREAFGKSQPVIEFVDKGDKKVRYEFHGNEYKELSS